MESLTADQIKTKISTKFFTPGLVFDASHQNQCSIIDKDRNNFSELCSLLCQYYKTTKTKPIKDIIRINNIRKKYDSKKREDAVIAIPLFIDEIQKIGIDIHSHTPDIRNREADRFFDRAISYK